MESREHPQTGVVAAKRSSSGGEALSKKSKHKKDLSDPHFSTILESVNKPRTGALSENFYERSISRAMRDTTGDSAAGYVSEESLFAAVAGASIRARRGGDAYRRYVELFKESDVTSFEERARGLITALSEEGICTREQANQIYSKAFYASQLDTNQRALYDSIGGGRDKTIATAATADAIARAKALLTQIDNKEVSVPLRRIPSE